MRPSYSLCFRMGHARRRGHHLCRQRISFVGARKCECHEFIDDLDSQRTLERKAHRSREIFSAPEAMCVDGYLR